MPFFAFIYSVGRGSFPVLVEDASIIAVLLKDLVEAKPAAQQMHFAVGNWDIYSCDAAGTKAEPQVALADWAVVTPAADESVVHLWVEPKSGAAAGGPQGIGSQAGSCPLSPPAPRPSGEPPTLGSVVTVHAHNVEPSSNDTCLLQAVHSAFGESTKARVRLVFKPSSILSGTFGRAQTAFDLVVKRGLALAPPAENAINFAGDFSGRQLEEFEIDCLVKLSAPAGSIWTRDPAAAASVLFHIRESGLEPLAPAPPSDALTAADAGGMPTQPAGAFEDKLSSTTLLHHPPSAPHYVIGDVVGGEGDGAPPPVQKLLQLERNLCFILEKERKPVADICSCVLGVVLIGPSMDSPTVAAVFAALSHYKSSLQRLWALSEAGRLLAIHQQPPVAQSLAVPLLLDLMRMSSGVARMEAAANATRAEVAKMSATLDRILELHAAGGGRPWAP
jgi:hypothetical protein